MGGGPMIGSQPLHLSRHGHASHSHAPRMAKNGAVLCKKKPKATRQKRINGVQLIHLQLEALEKKDDAMFNALQSTELRAKLHIWDPLQKPK